MHDPAPPLAAGEASLLWTCYHAAMPALPVVPGVVKVQLVGTTGGEPCRNITHWRYVTTSGDLTSAQLLVALDKFVNSWGTNAAPVINNTVSLLAVEGADLTSSTAATATAPSTHVGGASDYPTPPSTCVLESKTIARRYRGGHPRTYWPGPGLSQSLSSLGDQFNSGSLAAWQTAIEDYYGAIPSAVTSDSDSNLSSWHEVCVHYYSEAGGYPASGHVPLPAPYVDDVSANTIDLKWATQRRRMQRGG